MRLAWTMIWLAGCYTAAPGDDEGGGDVVFTYPADGQLDVPLGARLLVSFAGEVAPETAGASVTGPGGPVDLAMESTGRGKTLALTAHGLEPGTAYELRVGDAAVHFTTRSDRPRAGKPTLIAFDGSQPATPGTFRPVLETATVQLVFSEPLDPRTVALEPGAIELVDATGAAVPAVLVARGIHAAIDPVAPLVAGAPYELRLGDRLRDLGGEALDPATLEFTPVDSVGRGALHQTFRIREDGDPVAELARIDAPNTMAIAHPLIGAVTAQMLPTVLATELGDPAVQGGPIAFRIPRGQRLSSSGLDILLAGAIPSGLATGDVEIELVTDGTGRIVRNRFSPDRDPDNTVAPLLVDLSLDLAIFATDPTGNAVLAQTVLGVQLAGLAIADEGALAIETLGALDIGLLGVGTAPANIALDLISDPEASPALDAQPPALVMSLPAAESHDLVAGDGIELGFDEPIDLARPDAIALRGPDGVAVPSLLELHGSVVVVRPRAPLAADRTYTIELAAVADLAGNALAPQTLTVSTQRLVATDVPASVVAVYPGAPCALAGDRCAGAAAGDDTYHPFALAANERVAVVFDQPIAAPTHGTACGTGSVRVERVDAAGACVDAVPGTLVAHARELAFVPDRDWVVGEHYRLRLFSGLNTVCEPGDLCGANGRPANFDPLAGTAVGGGPDLVVDFVGAPATSSTTLLASAAPYTDLNGSGRVETGELARDANRVALAIAGTAGVIGAASFPGPDCVPGTPAVEACMYVLGAIPAQLGERRDSCALPDGTTAPTCVPVAMSAQAMYSTSVPMTAAALGIPLTTETGMSVLRIREPADRPLEGYIVDRGGTPTMVVALELYLDAPDMTLPLSQHDLHSKPLAVSLEGPVTFQPDGRIAISLHNLAEVPISVGITAPLGMTGKVDLVVPAGEMRLQLVSRSQRGSLP